jgi:hypothetical protein
MPGLGQVAWFRIVALEMIPCRGGCGKRNIIFCLYTRRNPNTRLQAGSVATSSSTWLLRLLRYISAVNFVHRILVSVNNCVAWKTAQDQGLGPLSIYIFGQAPGLLLGLHMTITNVHGPRILSLPTQYLYSTQRLTAIIFKNFGGKSPSQQSFLWSWVMTGISRTSG